MKSPTRSEQINVSKQNSYGGNQAFLYVLFSLLCILIFYPAYFRGLFFEDEQFKTYLFSFILFSVFAIYKVTKGTTFQFNNFLDYSLLGLVAMYIVSIVVAVTYRLAVSEALKYINYFVIFLLVKELVDSKLKINILLNILLVSITGVAFLGIGAATGTFTYNGAYSAVEIERWINSSL